MIIYNPLTTKVEIRVKGVDYSIPAQSSINVEESVGKHWLSVHGFLTDEVPVVTEKKKEPVAKVEEEADVKEVIAEKKAKK